MIDMGSVQIDPVAIGSQGNAVLGIRDSGKTYTATLLAEGLFEAGIPFIAFDPIGVWRFLRVPGAGRGYPVVVAGGSDGDLPLTPASVPALVEAAMKNGVSLVLDLFDINLSKADWRRIVMAALRTLLHQNHQYGLRHVFIEEAAEFAPQKVTDGHVYAEMEKLARMGGNARLGYTLINQRSEEVNKALLELCDNLFLHRQKGRNSLTALSKWLDIGNVADGKAIISTLSTLPTGECWAWLAGSDTPVHTKVPTKNSLHPDRRVMRGDSEALKSRPVDVDAFVESMRKTLGAAAEDAKANDPSALKAEVARLTRELAKVQRQVAAPPPAPEPVVTNQVALDEARAEGQRVGIAIGIARAQSALNALRVDRAPAPRAKAVRAAPVPREAAIAAAPAEGLTGPQRTVLRSLAWWRAVSKDSPTRNQVAVICGWSTNSSNIRDRVGELVRAGLVDRPSPGALRLTESGIAAAPEPDLGTTLHDSLRRILTGPQRLLFDHLLSHGGPIGRDDLATAVGWSTNSSNIRDRLGELARLDIIERPTPGVVALQAWVTE